MISELTFSEALTELDLDPLRVEIEELEPAGGADAYLTLVWEGDPVAFVAEFKNARDRRALQLAIRRARERAEGTGRQPLVVVPYLNDDWLAFLRSERVSGLDLSGNAWIRVPGRWSCLQRGYPSRFRETTRSRTPYRGKSGLVGRVLLSRPQLDAVGEVQAEIDRRDGTISLAQVSKVLSALERDLIIRRDGGGIRLIQPERLLDALTEHYRLPQSLQDVTLKANLGQELFAELAAAAGDAGVRIAGYQPARYAIAPETGTNLLVYVEPRGLSRVSQIRQVEPSRRFANLTLRAVEETTVFFDRVSEGGFRWCSPLETYLQLMSGGKRERDSAGQLRMDILEAASA